MYFDFDFDPNTAYIYLYHPELYLQEVCAGDIVVYDETRPNNHGKKYVQRNIQGVGLERKKWSLTHWALGHLAFT